MNGGDGWKPGDLAMVIRTGRLVCEHGVAHLGAICPPLGSVHKVTSTGPTVMIRGESCGCTAVRFENGQTALTQRVGKYDRAAMDAEADEYLAALFGEGTPA